MRFRGRPILPRNTETALSGVLLYFFTAVEERKSGEKYTTGAKVTFVNM